MTNKEKAQEIGEKCAVIVMEKCSCEYECTQSALLMAQWKDEQFAKEKQELIDKACEWLEHHLYDDEYTFRDDEGTWVETFSLSRGLKQAMKGGGND